jgi:hypothetical protein
MKKHCYTPEELQFLKDSVVGRSHAELTELFNKKFNLSQTVSKIKGFLIGHGLKTGKLRYYTPEQIQFLKDHVKGRSYAELVDMFNRKFNCSIGTKKLISTLTRYHLKTGLAGFRFRPGHRAYINSHYHHPIGTEITNNKYILVKVVNPNVWRRKHIVIWEAANGPFPEGHHIIFADGNKSNFNLENLLLVSKRELMVMNSKHLIFPDAKRTKNSLLVVKLEILANDKEREAKKLKHTT